MLFNWITPRRFVGWEIFEFRTGFTVDGMPETMPVVSFPHGKSRDPKTGKRRKNQDIAIDLLAALIAEKSTREKNVMESIKQYDPSIPTGFPILVRRVEKNA